MPRSESLADNRRKVQAEYKEARAAKQAAKTMPPKETHPDTGPGVLEESLSGSNLESDLEEEESEGESQGGPAPSGTKRGQVIEREFFDWKGNKLDVKITEKAVTFEGKRYTGHKWNTAIDMIMARGKKPSTKKKPDYLIVLTDAEIAAAEKKRTAAEKAKVKARAHRQQVAERQAQMTRESQKANKGGLLNWMGKASTD